jgi:hypothetical protein
MDPDLDAQAGCGSNFMQIHADPDPKTLVTIRIKIHFPKDAADLDPKNYADRGRPGSGSATQYRYCSVDIYSTVVCKIRLN